MHVRYIHWIEKRRKYHLLFAKKKKLLGSVALRPLFKAFGCCLKTGSISHCGGPQWSLPHHMTVFRVIWLPICSYPLYHLMIHGEKPQLDGCVGEIWNERRDEHKEREEPVKRGRCTGFNKDLVGSSWYAGIHCSISQEEYIPEYDATPNEEMLDICEIVDG